MVLAVAFLLAVGAALIEAGADGVASDKRSARISVVLGLLALVVSLALEAFKAPAHAPATRAGPFVVAAIFVVTVIVDDFLYYWAHRISHRVGVFWASHAVHHSAAKFDFFMGLRQPPTWVLTPAAIAPFALALIGFPPAMVAGAGAFRGVYHFVLHTERIKRAPAWIESALNTPGHHRVHHASAGAPRDRNFGGVFIIWDRLFGTYAPPCAQGLSYGVEGQSPPTSVISAIADPWRAWMSRFT